MTTRSSMRLSSRRSYSYAARLRLVFRQPDSEYADRIVDLLPSRLDRSRPACSAEDARDNLRDVGSATTVSFGEIVDASTIIRSTARVGIIFGALYLIAGLAKRLFDFENQIRRLFCGVKIKAESLGIVVVLSNSACRLRCVERNGRSRS